MASATDAGVIPDAIAVGRYADLIAVDGDPIRIVQELEDVDVAIRAGKVVKRD